MLSIKDISKICGVSHTTVREWLLSGKLPAYRFGRRWGIDAEDFKQFLKRSKKEEKVKWIER